ncbi:MAG: hypothetical protein IOC75_06600 [Rhodobacter sp.]|nr:hypothetical protein [Rhodobacter sp.]
MPLTELQQRFLDAYSETGNVRKAVMLSGCSYTQLYGPWQRDREFTERYEFLKGEVALERREIAEEDRRIRQDAIMDRLTGIAMGADRASRAEVRDLIRRAKRV